MRKPKILTDLIGGGIPIEEVRKAFVEASTRVEEARSGRSVCRICGQRIRRGELRVVSEDRRLVDLFECFWSSRLYVHLGCYRRLLEEGDGK